MPEYQPNKEPKRKKIRYSIILIVSILLIAGITYLARKWCDFRKIYKVDKITVSGTFILTQPEIHKKIESHIANKNLKQINCDTLQKSLAELPYVEASNVVKRFPDGLDIQIVERIPLCYLITDNNNFVLDARGVVLPVPDNSINTNLPLITGKEIGSTVQIGEKVQSPTINLAITFLNQLKHRLPPIFAKVSEINYEENKKEYNLFLNSNTKVLLGRKKIYNRLNVLIHFMKQLPTKNDIADYQYLDLRWKDQIVARSKHT